VILPEPLGNRQFCLEKIEREENFMAKRLRPVQIKFFVSEYEKELIDKKMKLFGIRNMSAYLRKIAIDGRLIKVETSGLDELCRQVSGVSKNINQIAKRINSTNDIYADDVIAMKQELEKIWQLLKSTLSALL